jgi:hypothetical protein
MPRRHERLKTRREPSPLPPARCDVRCAQPPVRCAGRRTARTKQTVHRGRLKPFPMISTSGSPSGRRLVLFFDAQQRFPAWWRREGPVRRQRGGGALGLIGPGSRRRPARSGHRRRCAGSCSPGSRGHRSRGAGCGHGGRRCCADRGLCGRRRRERCPAFDVGVGQADGCGVFAAADRPAGDPIEIGQARQTVDNVCQFHSWPGLAADPYLGFEPRRSAPAGDPGRPQPLPDRTPVHHTGPPRESPATSHAGHSPCDRTCHRVATPNNGWKLTSSSVNALRTAPGNADRVVRGRPRPTRFTRSAVRRLSRRCCRRRTRRPKGGCGACGSFRRQPWRCPCSPWSPTASSGNRLPFFRKYPLPRSFVASAHHREIDPCLRRVRHSG